VWRAKREQVIFRRPNFGPLLRLIEALPLLELMRLVAEGV
jgi:hypothetical protein